MRYFLEIAYKGTNYHGWQIQPNAVTVQSTLNEALKILLKEDIATTGSGRTDTGVHALKQVVHFDYEHTLDFPKFINSLNGILPNDISVFDAYLVNSEAHTRFDAVLRGYVYKIRQQNTPFQQGEYYLYKRALDIDQMNKAAKILLKNTDFESFSKIHTEVKTFNCDISKAEWIKTESGLEFHIEADRFLRGMVRAVVGTLKEVGLGKMTVKEFEDVILAKDRSSAGAAAPAQGLFLCRVDYPESIYSSSFFKD